MVVCSCHSCHFVTASSCLAPMSAATIAFSCSLLLCFQHFAMLRANVSLSACIGCQEAEREQLKCFFLRIDEVCVCVLLSASARWPLMPFHCSLSHTYSLCARLCCSMCYSSAFGSKESNGGCWEAFWVRMQSLLCHYVCVGMDCSVMLLPIICLYTLCMMWYNAE